jgi:FlaA1/EpsC-like NDP-sugar epimerase
MRADHFQPSLVALNKLTKLLFDVLLWTAATPIAFWLRLDDRVGAFIKPMLILTLGGAVLKLVVVLRRGTYRSHWAKIGATDVAALVRSVVWVSALLAVATVVLQQGGIQVPRSVPIIEALVALILLGGVRYVVRAWRERRPVGGRRIDSRRILIVGAGEAGTTFVREMQRHPEVGLQPIGFLDDDPAKGRDRLRGLPVLGRIEDLAEICVRQGIHEVVIAIPSAPGHIVRRVVALAQQAGVGYRILPALHDLLSGKLEISQIRDVDVADLLRREPVKLDLAPIAAYLAGRTILVTGAGGSIGSEIVRQTSRFQPKRLILLGRGENSLWQIEQELRRDQPGLDFAVIVADVRDRAKLAHVFAGERPEVVFHAAAHKHVPLMEANPDEAVLNNVGGTRNVVDMALEYGVSHMVNISTDKAVNPTSIMGATKRVAEYLVAAAARRAAPGQVFVSVRFGNVLGSRGSVIPVFREQIRRGGPITVTHPDMRRYFMTIPEAAQLVLQAAGLGGNGSVYVLDMGDPVKIVDLAEDLIRLSGLTPGRDVEIVFTGMRPGEKLFEELLTAEEGTTSSRFDKIHVARNACPEHGALSDEIGRLLDVAALRESASIRAAIQALVPNAKVDAGT